MGADHANIISSKTANATISEVYDSNVKHAHKIAKLVGNPKVKNSAFEVINSPDVDAIIIVSPDETHSKFTLEFVDLVNEKTLKFIKKKYTFVSKKMKKFINIFKM